MSQQKIQENHFVPQSYLRRWAKDGKTVWMRRLLVSHPEVPHWKMTSIRGIAKIQNLYTRATRTNQSDETERWLNDEFESPAQRPIEKAISGYQLERDDWRKIVRYLAAQDVRTPTRMLDLMSWSDDNLPKIMQDTIEKAVQERTARLQNGDFLTTGDKPKADFFPIRITREFDIGTDRGFLRAETLVGRALWLHNMRSQLTTIAEVLHQHKWTILQCAEKMQWVTSDNPVVKLSPRSTNGHNLKAGWIEPGAQIFMPIGPRHLLYTRVGSRPPQRGTILNARETQNLQQIAVANAYRFIYAAECDLTVAEMRARHESLDDYNFERQQWSNWHKEQSEAERSYFE